MEQNIPMSLEDLRKRRKSILRRAEAEEKKTSPATQLIKKKLIVLQNHIDIGLD